MHSIWFVIVSIFREDGNSVVLDKLAAIACL